MEQPARPFSLDTAVNLVSESVNKQVRQTSSVAPVFLGISGIDCSGKTTLAKALLKQLTAAGLSAQLVMVDDFIIRVSNREQEGSPEIDYFESTFDHEKFTRSLRKMASQDGVQVVIGEGVFLFRRELVQMWDLKVWIEMSLEQSLLRGQVRDAELFGSQTNAAAEYQSRFMPAHVHHLERDEPARHADFIFNAD